MKHLMTYGKECEYLGKVEDGFKIRIVEGNRVTEDILDYEPILNEFKYDDKYFKQKINGQIFRAKKYTTYLKDGGLIRAYNMQRIKNPTWDSMIYEFEILERYELIENPFLSPEEIEKLLIQRDEEKKPINSTIENLEKDIENLKKELNSIDKKFDIDNKCPHDWVKIETIEEGRSVEEIFECQICSIEKRSYSTRIF